MALPISFEDILRYAERTGSLAEASVMLQRPVPGLTARGLTDFVAHATRAMKLAASVHVLATSNARMRALNRRFRGKDQPTDVLSFPAVPECHRYAGGDIAISLELAAANSRRLGHSVAEEIKILVLHGLLHLAGYDHEQDDGEMARREQRLRSSLHLPVGLIERNGQSGQTRGSPARGKKQRQAATGRQRRAKTGLTGTR
jgi:probable rRNA maturation factor